MGTLPTSCCRAEGYKTSDSKEEAVQDTVVLPVSGAHEALCIATPAECQPAMQAGVPIPLRDESTRGEHFAEESHSGRPDNITVITEAADGDWGQSEDVIEKDQRQQQDRPGFGRFAPGCVVQETTRESLDDRNERFREALLGQQRREKEIAETVVRKQSPNHSPSKGGAKQRAKPTPKKHKMDKQTQRANDLAQHCLLRLGIEGLTNIKVFDSAEICNLKSVWTGLGSVDEVIMTGSDGSRCSFIAKSIQSHKNIDNEKFDIMDHNYQKKVEDQKIKLVNHMSYYNEMAFYESGIPGKMHKSGVNCPRPLHIDRTDENSFTICMSKVKGGLFDRRHGTKPALVWLARLHALFWGDERAGEAVAAGISNQGTFWNLIRREIELKRIPMSNSLRLSASGLHARLMADNMQTMCHGDPKGANIAWDEHEGVSFYDFQWFGKGPCSKDLAYFFAVGIGANPGLDEHDSETNLLRYYHAELSRLLKAQGDLAPTFEYLWDSYRIAICDLGRWMTGGFAFGNTAMVFDHVKSVFKLLEAGAAFDTTEQYQQKIFEVFPP